MSENIRENKMGVQSVHSLLLSMSIPMMISMLVQALYNVVDTMFVSGLGQDALTALSLAFPVQNLLIAVGVGTGVGTNALLSRSLGEKNFERANKVANNGLFLSLISTIVVMVLSLFSGHYFKFFGSSTNVVEMGTQYLGICMFFSVGLFGQTMFEKLLQSTGKTACSMVVQLIGAVINIILDPILIYGYLGFPELGVRGAAIATVVGQIISLFAGMVINHIYNKEISVSLREILRPESEIIKRIYSVGVPSICMASIGSVMNVCINQIMRIFGTAVAETGQAVFGIYFKLQSFIFMPIFGLNNGMVPIVAYNYGAKNRERIKKTIKLSIIYATAIMIAGFTLFQLIPENLLRIFDTGEEQMKNIIGIGVPMMRYISISFLAAGFCIVAGSVFQALGKGMLSLVVSVCRQLLVLVPTAFLLSILTRNITVMWLAFPIAEIASFTLSFIFMKRIYKKEINIL